MPEARAIIRTSVVATGSRLDGPAWGRRLAATIVAATALASVLWLRAYPEFGARPAGARLARLEASPNWQDGRFVSPLPRRAPGLVARLGAWLPSPRARPRTPPPIERRRGTDFIGPPRGGLRLTWLGHASVLIEIEGYRILTDPVWSDRIAPRPLGGPSRFHPPPLPIDDLPRLDAVLISHDHYDHLDRPTVLALRRTVRRFVVPLGVGAHLEHWGVPADRITELDWWEETAVDELRLVATPARHASGRSLFGADTDGTLWSGWAVVGRTRRVLFSGATAMFGGLADIGRRLGPFDATLLGIGGYSPATPDLHLGPEQAVRAHVALQGRVLLPIHWGTFDLAQHGWTEPIERTLLAADRAAVDIVVPVPGQGVEPLAPPPVIQWWPEVPWNGAETSPVRSSGMTAAP